MAACKQNCDFDRLLSYGYSNDREGFYDNISKYVPSYLASSCGYRTCYISVFSNPIYYFLIIIKYFFFIIKIDRSIVARIFSRVDPILYKMYQISYNPGSNYYNYYYDWTKSNCSLAETKWYNELNSTVTNITVLFIYYLFKNYFINYIFCIKRH